jgi:hypothetical protein
MLTDVTSGDDQFNRSRLSGRSQQGSITALSSFSRRVSVSIGEYLRLAWLPFFALMAILSPSFLGLSQTFSDEGTRRLRAVHHLIPRSPDENPLFATKAPRREEKEE